MRKVLVVDDEESIVAAIAEGLPMVSKQPVEIKTALSGEAARRILEAEPDIDVIFCDARMPGVTGLDLLAWCKARGHKARRILITAYSAHVFPEREIERASPVLVLTKPLSLSELAKLAQSP